jgi:hypothetical protein
VIPGSGRCHYHADRPGLGVCVECRNVICLECTTQFDGINRCAQCLSRRLGNVRAVAPRREWGAVNVILSLFSLAAVFGAVYLAAQLLS